MGPEATSGAPQAEAQEAVTQSVTTPSEAQAGEAQEQSPQATATEAAAQAPQIDDDALVEHPRFKERLEAERRKLQSLKDREVAVERQRMQRQLEEQQRQAAEQQRLAGMDDEEYGAYMRDQAGQRQRDATLLANRDAQWEGQRQQWVQNDLDGALSLIKDTKTREAMAERATEFETFAAFNQACAQVQIEAEVARATGRAAKTAREATAKDATARLAETAVPDLATGQPSGSTPRFRNSTERIAWGLEHEK